MKIKEYIHEILSIVLDINGIEERSVEKTGEKPTCAWNAEEELERTAKCLKSFRDDMLFLDDEHV